MRKSKKQFFWEFMRRHRKFRVGDAMIALDLSKSYAKQILWQLEGVGYVRLVQDAKRYEDRIYQLVRECGIKAPVLINGKVKAPDGSEVLAVQKRIPKRLPRRMIPTKLKLLLAMREERMSKQSICERAGVNPHSGSAKRAFHQLQAFGVLVPTNERSERKRLYRIDMERRKEAMALLKMELEKKRIGRAKEQK